MALDVSKLESRQLDQGVFPVKGVVQDRGAAARGGGETLSGRGQRPKGQQQKKQTHYKWQRLSSKHY